LDSQSRNHDERGAAAFSTPTPEEAESSRDDSFFDRRAHEIVSRQVA